MPSLVGDNGKARTIDSRVNNVVKFAYNLGSALQSKYQHNNCYYLLKKRFVRAGI